MKLLDHYHHEYDDMFTDIEIIMGIISHVWSNYQSKP